MKKSFDWLGLIVLVAYLLVFLFLFYLGFLLKSPTCYGIAIVYGFVAACLAYPTLYYTRKFTSKPIIEKAVLVAKTVKCKKYYDEIGCETQRPLYFLTFQIFGHDTTEFHVKKEDYDKFTENTAGLLTYKKYKKQFYFISFERK